MIFVMNVSTAFVLSVFLGSIGLIIWSMRNKGEGVFLGKIIGIVTALSCLFSLICIGYYGFQYWLKGEYETSYIMPAKHADLDMKPTSDNGVNKVQSQQDMSQ